MSIRKPHQEGLTHGRLRAALAALMGVGVLAGGSVVAFATTSSPAPISPGAWERGQRAPLAQAVDPLAATNFAVLDRAVTPSDAIPSEETVGLQDSSFTGMVGGNVALAREATGFSVGAAWVVPADGGVCLLADPTYTASASPATLTGGADCAADQGAINGDAATVGYSPQKDPGHYPVAGLVPNGVATVALALSNGQTETLQVHDNVYMANPASDPVSVVFVNASGVQSTVDVSLVPMPASGS